MVSPRGEGLTPAQRAVARAGHGEMALRRALAAAIDLVFVVGLLWAMVEGGVYVFGIEALAPAVYAWLALAAVYFPLAEGLFGRTLGKLAAHIEVVDDAGRPPGLAKAGIRAFVRLLEANPLLLAPLPAAVAIALSRHRRRLGDIAAETYVVRSDALRWVLDDPAPLFD